jgi:hypothetical protein
MLMLFGKFKGVSTIHIHANSKLKWKLKKTKIAM